MRTLELTAHVKAIGRAQGRTATAAAAYRACERIVCEREGRVHDYRRKQGLEASAIVTPDAAPAALLSRSGLWNGAELRERNGSRGANAGAWKATATVAREVVFGFPAELSPAGRLALAHEVARHLVAAHGVAVDFSIHAPGKMGDQRNHHCHLLMTTRRVAGTGLTEKAREWDGRQAGSRTVTAFRATLAGMMNAALAAEGHGAAVHVEHRSFKARGLAKAATTHKGPGKTNAELATRLQRSPAAKGRVPARFKGWSLSADQLAALAHVLDPARLAAVEGIAGTGKSTMLDAARQSWEAAGLRVQGLALAAEAAHGLQTGSGIASGTIHGRLFQWEQGRTLPGPGDVVVVDEAGMVGSRQMERLLHFAAEGGAKIVLVGGARQLQAIEAGGAFRAIAARLGAATLTTVRRQNAAWQRDATAELADGRTATALARYEAAGMVHSHATRAEAQATLIAAWDRARVAQPGRTQLVMAFLRRDVAALNARARACLRRDGTLGPDVTLDTAAGPLPFATGDRLAFQRNDAKLGVRNGSLGTVEAIHGRRLTIRLDGDPARYVTFGLNAYGHIAHGYAATIHKSQGATVDRAHLYVSPNLGAMTESG